MHDELAGPGQARHDAPETSKTAAKLEQGPLRYRVLARFAEAGNNGLITIEAADLFPNSPVGSISTRISELLRDGLLEETGESRVSRYGTAGLIRRITPAGLALLNSRTAP